MTTSSRTELIIIDPSIAGWQTIRAGLDPSAEVFLLDPARDGVGQLADILAGRTDIDALHIFSHGASGEIQLGGTWLNTTNLGNYAEQWAQVSASLSAGADILLYGCDVAQGGVGQAFIQHLSAVTGADVAASVDTTGSALVGGNWQLEAATGPIEANALTASQFSEILAGATYGLSASATSVNEGSAVTFTVATTNVAANTVLNYTLGGAGITVADIGGAALTGTTAVGSDGTASFIVNLSADQLSEGTETLTATVMGQSASVTVNDTSTTPVVPGRSKYFVLPSSVGANFTDFDLSHGTVTLIGEQVTFVGSSAVDAVFARPGVTLDFTLSGAGADKIYGCFRKSCWWLT